MNHGSRRIAALGGASALALLGVLTGWCASPTVQSPTLSSSAVSAGGTRSSSGASVAPSVPLPITPPTPLEFHRSLNARLAEAVGEHPVDCEAPSVVGELIDVLDGAVMELKIRGEHGFFTAPRRTGSGVLRDGDRWFDVTWSPVDPTSSRCVILERETRPVVVHLSGIEDSQDSRARVVLVSPGVRELVIGLEVRLRLPPGPREMRVERYNGWATAEGEWVTVDSSRSDAIDLAAPAEPPYEAEPAGFDVLLQWLTGTTGPPPGAAGRW